MAIVTNVDRRLYICKTMALVLQLRLPVVPPDVRQLRWAIVVTESTHLALLPHGLEISILTLIFFNDLFLLCQLPLPHLLLILAVLLQPSDLVLQIFDPLLELIRLLLQELDVVVGVPQLPLELLGLLLGVMELHQLRIHVLCRQV